MSMSFFLGIVRWVHLRGCAIIPQRLEPPLRLYSKEPGVEMACIPFGVVERLAGLYLEEYLVNKTYKESHAV